MISHVVPQSQRPNARGARLAGRRPRSFGCDTRQAGPAQGGQGPLCLPFHLAAGLEGESLHPGLLPRRASARWVRRALLLSGTRPSGRGCRGQCVAGGNRDVDGPVLSVLGGTGAVLDGAFRDERSPQDGQRGQGGTHRPAQDARRHRRGSDLCRARTQISDLGAGTLSRGARGGHREGPRDETAARFPGGGGRSAWSTGMMAGSDGSNAVAGGPARHIPVLGRPAVEFLNVRDDALYVDATFGGGGYSRAILSSATCCVIGLDRDPNAIAQGEELARASAGRLVLMQYRFSDLHDAVRAAGRSEVDGVVFDLGVSSMQLDDPSRGFSFRHEGSRD